MGLYDRAAVFGVPAFAGLVTAAVLLGPGAERPAIAARVHGLPAASARALALRVQTLAYLRGAYQDVAIPEIEIAVARDEAALERGALLGSWRGAAGRAWVEALVEASEPLGANVTVRVRAGAELLAQGTVSTLAEPLPTLMATEPIRRGDKIEVVVARGVLVAPFAERVEVRVTLAERPELSLRVEVAGGELTDLERAAPVCKDGRCLHVARMAVRPTAPGSQLIVVTHLFDAQMPPESDLERWEIELPVHNGGVWLDPEALGRGVLALHTAIPKDEAYVSLLAASGRAGGAVVPMRTDERGYAHGEVALPPLPAGAITALVSGDPFEPMTTSVAWPLRPGEGLIEPRASALLLDGIPAKRQLERQRRARVRWPAIALVGAAALFELAYLWRRGLDARDRLREHLRRAAGDEARDMEAVITRPSMGWLSLLAFGLVVAFAALAAIVAFSG